MYDGVIFITPRALDVVRARKQVQRRNNATWPRPTHSIITSNNISISSIEKNLEIIISLLAQNCLNKPIQNSLKKTYAFILIFVLSKSR
jgi:hypothetical protein